MKLVDKNITEIISSYEWIAQTEIEIRSRWRPALLRAYTRRRQAFEEQSTHKWWRDGVFWLGGSFSLLLFSLGAWQAYLGFSKNTLQALAGYCLGPLLMTIGILLFVAVIISLRSRQRKNIRIPLHPIKHNIIPDLRSAWKSGLTGIMKNEIPQISPDTNSDLGLDTSRTKDFIRYLMEALDDRYYGLTNLTLLSGIKVNFLVLGPSGLWIFNFIPFPGIISWDSQGWALQQNDNHLLEFSSVNISQVIKKIEENWRGSAIEITRTLQVQAPQLLDDFPILKQPRGGLVFTHEFVSLQGIQPLPPISCGRSTGWVKQIADAKAIQHLDDHSALRLVETLLSNHQDTVTSFSPRSMQEFAHKITQGTDNQLSAWINQP